jgi:UDP:flavonoid glycosyltransferase YjiC (YdhE family)
VVFCKNGQEVIYYLPEEFQDTVEATGATFRSYESQLMKHIAKTSLVPGEESRLVLPQVLDRIRMDTPDVIVHEPVCVWTRIVVQTLQVPAISLRPTYAMNEHFNMSSLRAQLPNHRNSQMREIIAKANADLAEVCASYHVPPMDLPSVLLYAEPLFFQDYEGATVLVRNSTTTQSPSRVQNDPGLPCH